MISSIHPNPWILLCTLSKELLRAEPEVLWLKDGNPPRQKVSNKYQKHIDKRDDLMEKYAKNKIDEDFYLQRMGAVSLKLGRIAHKTTNNVEASEGLDNVSAPPDNDSNDSLSETRPLPQSEDTDSFSDNDHHYGADAVTGGADRLLNRQIGKKKPNRKSKFISQAVASFILNYFSIKEVP